MNLAFAIRIRDISRESHHTPIVFQSRVKSKKAFPMDCVGPWRSQHIQRSSFMRWYYWCWEGLWRKKCEADPCSNGPWNANISSESPCKWFKSWISMEQVADLSHKRFMNFMKPRFFVECFWGHWTNIESWSSIMLAACSLKFPSFWWTQRVATSVWIWSPGERSCESWLSVRLWSRPSCLICECNTDIYWYYPNQGTGQKQTLGTKKRTWGGIPLWVFSIWHQQCFLCCLTGCCVLHLQNWKTQAKQTVEKATKCLDSLTVPF